MGKITSDIWVNYSEKWGENYLAKLAQAKARITANPQTVLECVRCGDMLGVFDVADGQSMCFGCREDEQEIAAMNGLITPSA